MPVPTDITAGTITITNGSKAVTGVGTGWLASDIRRGDLFIWIEGGDGFWQPIVASVESNTALTLEEEWEGPTLMGAPYRLRYQWDSSRVSAQARQLIDVLGDGKLQSLAGLPASADTLPYFNGAASMALSDFPAWARELFAETGQLPNARVRNDLTPDKAFRRGNILGEVSRSGGVPTGAIIEHGSNANGIYARYADGWQVCVSPSLTLAHINASLVGATWTFPVSFVPGGHVGGGIGFPSASANYTNVSSRDLGATIFNPQPSRGSTTVGASRITGAPSDTGTSIINCYAYASGPWI